MNAPTRIWIAAQGKEQPDWVVERMTTAEIAADGSFEIEASDGLVDVRPGLAIFTVGDQVFACPPREVQAKLAAAAGPTNEVVADLAAKETAVVAQAKARQASRPSRAGLKPLKLKPMIGEPPSPQFAGVERLHVDDTYQRSIEGGASRNLIMKIAENWDWRLCLPLLVSRRNGELFVIDGQHRLEAARLRGDIQHLPVVVFDFDDPKAEADLFVQANRSRRPMSNLDDFHAAVAAGDPKALEIHTAVTEAGLAVGRNQAWQMAKAGEVVFTQAIRRALRNHGHQIVVAALSMLEEAFRGQVLTTGTAIFEGLCTMLAESERDGSALDRALMVSVLGETGMAGWKEAVARANNGYERSELMLVAMRAAYAEAEGVD